MNRFSKFVRPESPRSGVISECDLDSIEAISRYRFSPTSELVRLVPGNHNVIMRRLRQLWEWGLVNRFAFPGIRRHSEFIYYLDSMRSLQLLVEHGRLSEVHQHMADEVRANREADYAQAAVRGQHMKLGFLQHSLMISRMHFMLEMSSRNPEYGVQIVRRSQGAELRATRWKFLNSDLVALMAATSTFGMNTTSRLLGCQWNQTRCLVCALPIGRSQRTSAMRRIAGPCPWLTC